MNAISRPPVVEREPISKGSADSDLGHIARTELVRHSFDLRLHAVIMAINAALAGYCGLLVTEADSLATPGEAMPFDASPDLMSPCAAAVFVAVAAPCLIEAHRCWKKASITSLRARTGGSGNANDGNPDPAEDEEGPHVDRHGQVSHFRPARGSWATKSRTCAAEQIVVNR